MNLEFLFRKKKKVAPVSAPGASSSSSSSKGLVSSAPAIPAPRPAAEPSPSPIAVKTGRKETGSLYSRIEINDVTIELMSDKARAGAIDGHLGKGSEARAVKIGLMGEDKTQVAVRIVKIAADEKQLEGRLRFHRLAHARAVTIFKDIYNQKVIWGERKDPKGVTTFYMAQSLFPKTTLADIIEKNNTEVYDPDLRMQHRLKIAQAILDITRHFYSKGYEHPDMHPKNYLVEESEDKTQAYLIDFDRVTAASGPDAYNDNTQLRLMFKNHIFNADDLDDTYNAAVKKRLITQRLPLEKVLSELNDVCTQALQLRL